MFLLQQESIVDSRFKLLASDFQNQIDYLKGEVFKENKAANKGVFESQHRHKIKKRQTKTSPLTPNILKSQFNRMNSSCTYLYPDYPDAGHEQIKNITIEKMKAKLIKPLCEHSTPICTFIHPDHPLAGRVNGSKTTKETNYQTKDDPTDANKTPTNLSWEEIELLKIQNKEQSKRIDQLEQKQAGEKNIDKVLDQTTEEMAGLKTQNRDQSNRIDQLEQKLANLQNTPPASPSVTRGNNKDKMKNWDTNYLGGQVSEALTLPSSCQDLAMLDYYLDGLYLVKNQETKKIQTVFCKFSADNKGRINKFLSQMQKMVCN